MVDRYIRSGSVGKIVLSNASALWMAQEQIAEDSSGEDQSIRLLEDNSMIRALSGGWF